MALRLDGKTALVTGASTGIGAAVARAFAEEGARLFLVAAPQDRETLTIVGGETGSEVSVADLGDPRESMSVFANAVSTLGSLDVLVNVAGYAIVEPSTEMTVDQWDRVLAVNLRSVMVLSREFARLARERGGGGAIVNTASTNAYAPEAAMAAYNASKAGVVSLTKTMAMEFGSIGIRVNAVHPGFTRTRQTEDLLRDPAFSGPFADAIPLGRVAMPEDIAPAYVFLASDEARYVTGATLVVDGGLTAGLRWPDVDVDYDNQRFDTSERGEPG